MLTPLTVSGGWARHPVSIRLKENAFCLFFTPTPFPLVKWMKLTPQLYCLRPRKVNGTARTETDKCPCDALQGNPATKAACKEGRVQQRARLRYTRPLREPWHQPRSATALHQCRGCIRILVPCRNRILRVNHPNVFYPLYLFSYLLSGKDSSSV